MLRTRSWGQIVALTKGERDNKVLTAALGEFARAQSATYMQREVSLTDRRFYTVEGAMWDGPLAEQFANRPKLEVNKVHGAVMRIVNEYRANRITVDFVPKDGDADDLADVCDGLYRADEQDSHSQEAMDNGFEEAIGGGMGAWRLRNEPEDDLDPENERQRIRIEPVFDADSTVFFDPNAKRQDKSDAQFAFVLCGMTKEAYKEAYKDDPASWPKEVQQLWGKFRWSAPDLVYIAEYYRIEEKRMTLSHFKTLNGLEEIYSDAELENDDLQDEIEARGLILEKTRKIKTRKVHKWIMSGGKVLEDCGYIAGPNIPIVPVYGKRWYIDGTEHFCGAVRYLKDTARLANMQRSRLSEISSLPSVEKPIFTPEQVAGHEMLWANDAVKNTAYMLVNPMYDAQNNPIPSGPMGYTKPPAVPPAMAALIQITEQDMIDVMGNPQAGESIQPQMSGRAVELVQNRIDMQAFIYMDNMKKAVERCGQIWLGMAREVYVEEDRKMKSVNPQGEVSSVVINQKSLDGMVETYENDMTKAKFDVSVDVGPTSSSRRAATVRALTGMMALAPDPQDQAVLSSLAMMNMEGEGLGEVRQYYRKKLVGLGVLSPNEKEQKEIAAAGQNQQPDPQAVLAQALAMEAEAKAMRAQADTGKAVAQTALAEADTIKTLAEVDETRRRGAVETAQAISGILNTQPPRGQVGENVATQPPSGFNG